MRTTVLGTTGITVSTIGLGTFKFGRNTDVKYPGGDGYALPDDSQCDALLDAAIALGVNVLDTAPSYGNAEERLGLLLGKRRQHFVLISKAGEVYQNGVSTHDFSADAIRHSVNTSRRRLCVDTLDVVLLHLPRDDLSVLRDSPAIATLRALQTDGVIGAVGASTMSIAGGMYAAERLDVVMVAYNPGYVDELPVINAARDNGCGVLIKKGLCSGHLTSYTATDCVRFVCGTDGVHSLIVGTSSAAHLADCVAAI